MNNELRRQISTIALNIRASRISSHQATQPIFVENYDIILEGKNYKRKKIILAAPGCTAATCNMCPIPNEGFLGTKKVFHEDYVAQFEAAFHGESVDDFQMIALYNSGNWFNDSEVPTETRIWFYQKIRNSECEAIAVESLPQLITERTIAEARNHLGEKQLVVGIGLQSADDFIRTVCVNTTCTKPQFERATKLLRENGYIPRVYLMIKPPFLTEVEAIRDTVTSIRYVAEQGYRDVSICPTRVVPNTVVAELAKQNLYLPPSFWSVIEILKQVNEAGIQTRVSCLDVDGKDADTIYPRNCEHCTPRILDALRAYNLGETTINELCKIECKCKQEFDQLKESEEVTTGTIPLSERVLSFINEYHRRVQLQSSKE